MSAREKIAYLRGLIEGQNMTENAGMSKFHEALLGALDSIVGDVDDLSESCEDLREYVEDLEDELMSLQEDSGEDISDCVCGEAHDGGEDYEEEEEYEPVTCPGCGKDFFYQPDAYDDDEDLLCPHCGKPFKK